MTYPCCDAYTHAAPDNHKAAGIRAVRREHTTDNASVAVCLRGDGN